MRVGVFIHEGPSGKELQIALNNVGNDPQTFFVSALGIGLSDAFDIFAVAPDRKRHQIFYWVGGEGRLMEVGLRVENVVEIPPGRSYVIRHLLKDLFEFREGGEVPLESLLRQGYAVVIDYDLPRQRVHKSLLYKYPSLWTGHIESGEVRLAGEVR